MSRRVTIEAGAGPRRLVPTAPPALVVPDCCGVPTEPQHVEYLGRPGTGYRICSWCSATERQEAERE